MEGEEGTAETSQDSPIGESDDNDDDDDDEDEEEDCIPFQGLMRWPPQTTEWRLGLKTIG